MRTKNISILIRDLIASLLLPCSFSMRRTPSGCWSTLWTWWCPSTTTLSSSSGLKWTRQSSKNSSRRSYRTSPSILVRISLLRLKTLWKTILEMHGVDPALFSLNWFLCLFVDTLPVGTYLHIWDSFLFEGSKVCHIVLLRPCYPRVTPTRIN